MTTLTSGRFNVGVLARTLALACGVALLGIASGRVAISHYGPAAVEALIAIPLLAYVVPRPYAGCMLLLVLLCSVVSYTTVPRVNLPGHPPLNLADVLLVAVVGATIWRRPWRTWPAPVKSFSLALGLLVLVSLIPAVLFGMQGHDQARQALDGFKDLLYIGVAITIALELSGKLWQPLLTGAIVLAVIVSLLSLAAAASGGLQGFLTTLDFQAVSTDVIGSTARIRLTGLLFVYAMAIPTLVMVFMVNDKWRPARIAALITMLAAIAVSLNRNMYLGAAAGVLVTLLLGGTRLRYRFVVVIVTIAAILAIVAQSTVVPAVTSQVASRAETVLTPAQVLSSSSIQTREVEFSAALTSISRHPWAGVGWYQQYGSDLTDTPLLDVEDWYLYLATDLGIPVAVLFLLVPGVLLVYGVRQARRARTPQDRAMVAAGVGTLVAVLMSATVGTYLQFPDTMLTFGFACGFVLATGLRVDAPPARGEPARADGAVVCA